MGQGESNYVHKEGTYRIAVIVGSLRKKSSNAGLVKAIVQLNHPAFSYDFVNIRDFPVFDEDVEQEGIPTPVKIAREQCHKADAILFNIPEYNFSMAGSFKNAYDWLSRSNDTATDPYDKVSPMKEKIGAMVSVAGMVGGKNAQDHFAHSSKLLKVKLMIPTEETAIQVNRFTSKKFDDESNLIDEDVRKKLSVFLDAF